MKYFLTSILIFSVYALLFVPAQAEEDENFPQQRPLTQTEEKKPLQVNADTCLEYDDDCNNNEREEDRSLRREEFRINVQSRLSTIHEQREERRANAQIRVAEDVQMRIESSLDQTITQFEGAIQRLSDIADRLEKRLTDMHERGFDVALSLETLDNARVEIASSTEAIDSIARSVDEALSSETPQSVREALRFSLGEARTSLRNGREALLEAVVMGRPSTTTDEAPSEQTSDAE